VRSFRSLLYLDNEVPAVISNESNALTRLKQLPREEPEPLARLDAMDAVEHKQALY